jgi:hypothetical protein
MRQSNTGYIALYDNWGEIIQLRAYNSLQRRRDILDGWQRMYGPRFSELTYGITPEISEAKLLKIELEALKQTA